MIQSFKCRHTEKLWQEEQSSRFRSIERVAFRRLLQLHAAESLADLRIPPGNRLEQLSGDRAGQYSIRINGQMRICFSWSSSGPHAVEIVDYH
jgi:proteic killer suppression protein